VIDLSHVWESVNGGLLILLQGGALILGGYLVWALHKYAKFLTAAQQEKLAGIINSGLNMAVNYAMTVATEQEKKFAPQAGSMVTRIAAQYAADHFGTTLTKMGKSPGDIAQMILARIPPPPTDKDLTGVTVKTGVVESGSLPPAGDLTG